MGLAKKMKETRRQVTRGGESFTEVKRGGRTFHVSGPNGAAGMQGDDRRVVEVPSASKLRITPERIIQNQGTAAPARAGQSATQGITQSGRIANAYIKGGHTAGGKPVVLNEQQTLAELGKLPAEAQAEVRRRMRAFKARQQASTGGARAPSA
jgi:hypothetical protein